MLLIYLILLIFFSFLLIKATEILVEALNTFSKNTKIGKFALSSSLIALTTSLPELFVGITAALEKKSVLSLGNVIGANIANISLVIGGAALVGGSIGIIGDFLIKDLFYALLAGFAPLLMLLDGYLSQTEGLLLLAIYGIYNFALFKSRNYYVHPGVRRLLHGIDKKETDRQVGWFFFGAALLIFSADSLVKIAEQITLSFKMPLFLIGLFLVSIGTSLPELSFEIAAVRKKQVGMVFGNLLGSIITNSTLIIGLVALVNPIVLTGGFKPYFWATVAFLLIFFIFWLFSYTKRKLERWEGIILILIYLGFIFFEFWRIG